MTLRYTSISGRNLTIDPELEGTGTNFTVASGSTVKLHQTVTAAQSNGTVLVNDTTGFENTSPSTLTVQGKSGTVTITACGKLWIMGYYVTTAAMRNSGAVTLGARGHIRDGRSIDH